MHTNAGDRQAPFRKLRAQVRRKGRYISRSFRRRQDADELALETERNIDRGLEPNAASPKIIQTFGDIIALHNGDMLEVRKSIWRSKAAVLEWLRLSLGPSPINDLRRVKLIEYGKKRAKQGAGPATLAIDFSFTSTTGATRVSSRALSR